MNRANQILLLIITVFLWDGLVSSQVHTFRNYSHKEGLDISSFLSVAEDDLGYLWFGSDGAGLVRFDGNEFDYLESIQGRSRRHVSGITFDYMSQPIFSTQYRGVFKIDRRQEESLNYIPQIGRARGVHFFDDRLFVIHDATIQLFKDKKLQSEKKLYPLNESLHLFGKYPVFDNIFVFTSRGNFVVHKDRIENLSDWLGTSDEVTKDLVGLIHSGDSLRFLSSDMANELTVLMENYRPKFFIQESLDKTLLDSNETILYGDRREAIAFFITNKNRLFKWSDENPTPKFIINNSDVAIENPSAITIDRNFDVWITTLRKGLFKVALEPFTPVQLHEVYMNQGIMFVHKTEADDIVISNADKKTFISYQYTDDDFQEYDFYTKTTTSFQGIDLIGTEKGVYEIDNSKIFSSRFNQFNDKNISLLFSDDFLYVAEEGVGLFRYDPSKNKVDTIKGMPAYIYTAQKSYDNSKIYFGSNLGILEYNKSTKQVKKIPSIIDDFDYGYYCGNSTVDLYETRWFSLDEGILGIKKNGEIVRRDVPQKAVFFEDFKVFAPAVDLAETRLKVQHRALVSLFSHAVEKITGLQLWKEELEKQQELLEFKVRHPEDTDVKTDPDHAEADDIQTQKSLKVLRDINRKLKEIKAELDTPEDRLKHLDEVLLNPEQYLRIERVDLKLSRLGIRLKPSSTEPANEFTVAEFELGKEPKQVLVWIRVEQPSVLSV